MVPGTQTMSKLSRTAALDYISKWSTNEVIEFLKKNGLEECCHAVLKRQIDGDELLHLTEGKLALWKSDLSRPQTWSLWGFVEELKRTPEEHVASHNIPQTDPEPVSDSGSWGTDFEDEDDEDDTSTTIRKTHISRKDIPQQSNDFRNSLMMFQRNEKLAQEPPIPTKPNDSSPESLYMNYGWETEGDGENDYMNLDRETAPLPKPVSHLHNKFEKSLAEQLREQLKLFGPPETKPVKMMKNPEVVMEKPVRSGAKPLQTSFLHVHSVSNRLVEHKDIKKPAVPPPRPEKPPRAITEKSDELPKPPVMLRNFDLVRDLPIKTDESDDEYEPFDEHIIEQNRIQMGSKQSLIQGSVESVYKPASTTSQEKDDCEIYEVITENPDDSGYYIEPIVHPSKDPLPPLPAASITSESIATSTSAMPKIQKKRERSPDKKSATLPHSGSITSLSAEMRATRPLPPPPFGEPYMESPWFHNITREQATALIKERACSSSHNGYFLLRPSTSDSNSPLVLVLWFKDRVYNVPVRRRPDGRYALGSLKINEQTFPCVEDIIKFHLREELLLYSGGAQMGSTKLADTPPK